MLIADMESVMARGRVIGVTYSLGEASKELEFIEINNKNKEGNSLALI